MKIIVRIILLIAGFAASWSATAEKPGAGTLRAWESYVALAEQRIAAGHEGAAGTVRTEPAKQTRSDSIPVTDGLIHHATGAVFVPNISVASVLRWMQRYDRHHRYFSEVAQSRQIARDGNTFRISYRIVRANAFLAAHYNTDHTVVYRQHGAGRASSRSVATRIAEIEHPGTTVEAELPVGNDRGYLWRLNSYWRFTEHDGGVVIECESISLSRAIPFGLGWLLAAFVEAIPRDSLESTLVSVRDGIGAAPRDD